MPARYLGSTGTLRWAAKTLDPEAPACIPIARSSTSSTSRRAVAEHNDSVPATPLSRALTCQDRRLCVPASRRVCHHRGRTIAFDFDNKQLYERSDNGREVPCGSSTHAATRNSPSLGYHRARRDIAPGQSEDSRI